MGGERLAEALPVIEDGTRPCLVEDGQQLVPRRRLARPGFFRRGIKGVGRRSRRKGGTIRGNQSVLIV